MAKWNPTYITRIQDRSPTVKSFWLKLPHHERIEYEPGQFITLELPVAERRRDGWRSYSIAAAPNDTNEVELCIVKLPGGKGSTWLFERAGIGTEIKAKDPGGVFTLPSKPLTNDVVMVCTGTGVAPFRAMLQDRLGDESAKFHLIFGCRTERDVLYREEFERMEREHDNFTYTVALSREERPGRVHGYVHQVYEQAYGALRDDLIFYLCGWSVMIDEAVDRLDKLGYDKSQVVAELYG